MDSGWHLQRCRHRRTQVWRMTEPHGAARIHRHTPSSILGADWFICFWRGRHTVPYRVFKTSSSPNPNGFMGVPYCRWPLFARSRAQIFFWVMGLEVRAFPLVFGLDFFLACTTVLHSSFISASSLSQIEVQIPWFFYVGNDLRSFTTGSPWIVTWYWFKFKPRIYERKDRIGWGWGWRRRFSVV